MDDPLTHFWLLVLVSNSETYLNNIKQYTASKTTKRYLQKSLPVHSQTSAIEGTAQHCKQDGIANTSSEE